MDLTILEILGNSGEDVAIAIGILVASLAGARLLQHLLLQHLQNRPIHETAWIMPYQLNRALTLLVWLLPFGGLLLVCEMLLLEGELRRWIYTLTMGGTQVIVALTVLTFIGSFRESRDKSPQDRSEAENRLLALLKKGGIVSRLELLAIVVKVLMVALPTTAVLNRCGIFIGLWLLPAILSAIAVMYVNATRRQDDAGPLEAPPMQPQPSGSVPVKPTVAPGTDKTDSSLGRPENEQEENEDDDATDRRAIVAFFLRIFSHQSEAPQGGDSRIRRIPPDRSVSYHTYELSVKNKQGWQTRRMTISRLGRETGSRSKCYYVIYNSHLVVKIPPGDIVDFDRYIESIERETRIAEQLAIRECIVPSVSGILQFIDPSFKKTASLFSPAGKPRLETLAQSPRLQSFLKIGNTFAFFMDLSAYYFLEHVIEEFHENHEKVQKEIMSHAKIAWDYLYFENQYGEAVIPIINRLEKMHGLIEREILHSSENGSRADGISAFHIKRDFFTRLAGIPDAAFQQKMPAGTLEQLEKTFLGAFDRYQPAVESYRYTVADAINGTQFARNRSAIAGIVTNLLVLLEHLKERTVSMRDLKPDNLLVAGDRSDYPQFLSKPESYRIGIIDVETAVIYGDKPVKDMTQPQLGGTPVYATPSHFFPNRMLHNLLGDLQTSLHLQDWHAVLCIVYKAVTGEILFSQTGCLIPTIIKTIGELPRDPELFLSTARELSRSFWRQAFIEFHQKVQPSEERLVQTRIALPAGAAVMMRRALLREQKKTAARLEQDIDRQPLFKNQATRNSFRSLPAAQIRRYRQKLAARKETSPDLEHQKADILAFIDHLFRMKTRLEKQTRMLGQLTDSATDLPVDQLLKIMFEVVIRHMYREEWKSSNIDEPGLHPAVEHQPITRSTLKESRTWQTTCSGPDPEDQEQA